jgi:putative flavoprotein involved in K+ transport
MSWTEVIVIGAGQAGLAMSQCLGHHGIAHVVLERGRIGERWRSETWNSLRLLTPNWMSRLPGWSYAGDDPDGYMAMSELVGYLEGYARASDAPVHEGIEVRAVCPVPTGYHVETEAGVWNASAVVLATGHCARPAIPSLAARLPATVRQLSPSEYRSPGTLPPGGVLVVGASASGVQIAQELRRAGRDVVLSVGRHTRLPRRHRGRDIMWWLDRAGVLREPASRIADLERARAQPSLQLLGSPEGRDIDLGILREQGVQLAGRMVAAHGAWLGFRDDLAETCAEADARLARLLARLDPGAPPPPPVRPGRSPLTLDLERECIGTVIWATGYRRDWRWLKLPVTDAAGELIHFGGITPAPGLYALGLRFLRRRNSSFLDGVGADAAELAGHILDHLVVCRRTAA